MAKKAKEIPSLIVASKVKEYLKDQEVRTSGEAIEQINIALVEVLDKAVARTKANGRGTVKAADI